MAVVGSPAGAEQDAQQRDDGLVHDLGEELRWTVSDRKGWLVGMALNLVVALVVVGFGDYDPHVAGDFKIAAVGMAVVLYVLAGTVATNQLGTDGERVAAQLERGDTARRLLLSKNVVLSAMLVPTAILVSVLFRVLVDRWKLLSHAALYDAGAVFIWLGIGNVVSLLLPYRPIPIRARLKARKAWKRWAIRQVVPYALYYLGAPFGVMLPWAALMYFKVLGEARSIGYPLLFVANAVVVWMLGLTFAAIYGRRALPRLLKELRRAE